jgi:uncharacterized membrane protein YgcG
MLVHQHFACLAALERAHHAELLELVHEAARARVAHLEPALEQRGRALLVADTRRAASRTSSSSNSASSPGSGSFLSSFSRSTGSVASGGAALATARSRQNCTTRAVSSSETYAPWMR